MEKKYYKYSQYDKNQNAGIEIRKRVELNNVELDLLRNASLEDLGEIEAWTALGTNNQLSYSTHGIFRYFGKFPATIATHLINEYTSKSDYIMDPMSGSGTTAVESYLLERNCRVFDISPLSILLAKVKTTQIKKEILLQHFEQLKLEYKPLTKEEYDWAPIGLKDVDHWFLSATQDSIRGLIFLINKIENEDIKNFYTVCLAACIRSVSRATTQQGRLFLDVLTAKEDCWETFSKKVLKAIDAVSSLPNKKSEIEACLHDANEEYNLPSLNKLIIVHPPYFNSYKYSSINSLELAWLNTNHADVRKHEVREFFKVGKGEKVKFYVEDMVKTLTNMTKTLDKDGVLALMVGDSIIKGQYINATRQIIDSYLKENKKIIIEKVVLRVPKYTEASWTASQRRKSQNVGITLNDFIIIFRRIK